MVRMKIYKRTCNQCGRCCYTTPCALGLRYTGSESKQPCKALLRAGERYYCELYNNPEKYADIGWCLGDESLETGYKAKFSQMVIEMMQPMMINECDSAYGQLQLDMRIPVHQIQE